MILTARQVADMLGPENPNCPCPACLAVMRVKALICEPVTALEEEIGVIAEEISPDDPPQRQSMWLAVIMIAGARLRAQGMRAQTVIEALSHGAEMAADLNPLLCSQHDSKTQ